MEVARQRVGLDLVQPDSLPVRNDLVLEERIGTVPGAAGAVSTGREKEGGGVRRGPRALHSAQKPKAPFITPRFVSCNFLQQMKYSCGLDNQ